MKSKILAVGIIFLFNGLSVSSAISVDTRSDFSKKTSIENCGCNNINYSDIVKLKEQLNRFERYFELKPTLLTDNLELKSIHEDFIKCNISELESGSSICYLLYIYGSILSTRLNILFYFVESDILPGIIIIFIQSRLSIIFLRFLVCLALSVSLDCEWADIFTP